MVTRSMLIRRAVAAVAAALSFTLAIAGLIAGVWPLALAQAFIGVVLMEATIAREDPRTAVSRGEAEHPLAKMVRLDEEMGLYDDDAPIGGRA